MPNHHTLYDAAQPQQATTISPLARLKLIGELARIKMDLGKAEPGPLAAMKRLKMTARASPKTKVVTRCRWPRR